MFQRKIIEQLQNWLNKADRKPLLLSGARQIGKTWVLTIKPIIQYEKDFHPKLRIRYSML